jgi:predicted DNA-binding transcriptional regulator YafY
MRRADRLFDIIQTLRAARHPLTAASIAEKLEVTVRTIYRDIAALQASRVPIEGAPGLGYVLRRGFDLPPLMFTLEETDAIAIGVRLLRRLRDPKLQRAAESVLAKLAAVVPGNYSRSSSQRRFSSPRAAPRRSTGSTSRCCATRSARRASLPSPMSTKKAVARRERSGRSRWRITST